MKGDVKTNSYLLEAKTTNADSYILKKTILEKIQKEALKTGKIPMLILDIQGKRYGVLRACDLPDECGEL